MTYKAIMLLIQSGRTEGLAEKIDVLFAFGRLNSEEYTALQGMLNHDEEGEK